MFEMLSKNELLELRSSLADDITIASLKNEEIRMKELQIELSYVQREIERRASQKWEWIEK